MNRTRVRHLAVLAFAVCALLFLGTASTQAAEQPQRGGILKVVDVAEGAQPIGCPWEVRGIDSKLMKPVIESLIREDVNGKYHPWLATKWKIDTAKNNVVLTLRQGVKFHDGTD